MSEENDWLDVEPLLFSAIEDDEAFEVSPPSNRRRKRSYQHYARSNNNSNCCLERKAKLQMLAVTLSLVCLVFLIFYSAPFLSLSTNSSSSASPNKSSNNNNTQVPLSIENALLPPTPFPDTVPVNFVTFEDIHEDNFEFNINDSDVMVFLHIQKTGGTTFGKHLVQDIDLDNPCECWKRKKYHKKKKKKKNQHKFYKEDYDLDRVKRKSLSCECFRSGSKPENWLFSRYSTGWKCGLHADWTELTACVDHYLDSVEGHKKRRYFYITFLRNPVRRYLSEYHHVRRGATWGASQFKCNSRPATEEEIPPCYEGPDWSNVELDDFLACDSNMANNRQTRMLADLRLVNCYDTSGMSLKQREALILQSAKQNLERMAFFGLTEFQAESQFLFEETFNFRFRNEFVQHETLSSNDILDNKTLHEIEERNKLDMELYSFAREMMMSRRAAISSDNSELESKFTRLKNDENNTEIEEEDDDDLEY